jgi:hypothetical protein
LVSWTPPITLPYLFPPTSHYSTAFNTCCYILYLHRCNVFRYCWHCHSLFLSLLPQVPWSNSTITNMFNIWVCILSSHYLEEDKTVRLHVRVPSALFNQASGETLSAKLAEPPLCSPLTATEKVSGICLMDPGCPSKGALVSPWCQWDLHPKCPIPALWYTNFVTFVLSGHQFMFCKISKEIQIVQCVSPLLIWKKNYIQLKFTFSHTSQISRTTCGWLAIILIAD